MESRWSKAIGDNVVALAPVLGVAILAWEAFISETDPRIAIIVAAFGLIGLPIPAWIDARRRNGD